MTDTISTRSLGVCLSSRPILRDVSLSARAGRVLAIAGPSGSGKSTLLKALSGELPHSGEIRYGAEALGALKPHDLASRRGVLPQRLELGFPFRVDEVVALGLRASGRAGPSEAGILVARALSDVGLASHADRSYPELSGGEQQRVQLARVLCQVPEAVSPEGPRWLLLDEPVSSLDIANQILIMDRARRFADAGGGVIAVMHDLNLTALYADDLALMKAGRLVAAGARDEMMQDAILEQVFSCALRVNRLPENRIPFVLPHSLVRAASPDA